MTDLLVDYCSYEAAKFACEKWHYSETIPAGKLMKYGVWENDSFRGCIIFSRGASPSIGSPFGLEQIKVCELTRVALRSHKCYVSRMMSYAIKMFSSDCPKMRVIVSFADLAQDHHGGIYQAGNWYYLGRKSVAPYYKVGGKLYHSRSARAKFPTRRIKWLRENIDPEAKKVPIPDKLKYAYPLDDGMREQLKEMSEPYPSLDGGD